MKLTKYPPRSEWPALLQRPVQDPVQLREQVQQVLDAVRNGGDDALRSFTSQWDGVSLTDLAVSPTEWEEAIQFVEVELASAIRLAAENIRRFHASQIQAEQVIQTAPGVQCWRRSVGIERVGLYIPGGSAPLFSTVLMLGIPATLAGCSEIVLLTPPNREGKVHPAILFAAREAGITAVYKAGGAQAIAAMAYGTETIPAVSKIFGPGNQYVTCAKQLLQMQGVAIDMPAGPSELCVLADESANAQWIAADLLSQAEHGPDSQVLLVTDAENILEQVKEALLVQVERLPRSTVAKAALENSRLILVNDLKEAVDLVNEYAAEHLILACENASQLAHQVRNAGSVFLGHFSPESAGDYASGTNHTLPTNGFARAYSGVSVDSFVRKITFQYLSEAGLAYIGPAVVTMAEAEGLQAHAEAVKIRLS
ncbi:MAG: histidinol dehydrogenase [Chitinophagaceae bacterium]